MNTDHTPYQGFEVRGFPLTTILRGNIVVQDGEPVGPALGEVLFRSVNRFPPV
jgi:dihydropyrimidinase